MRIQIALWFALLNACSCTDRTRSSTYKRRYRSRHAKHAADSLRAGGRDARKIPMSLTFLGYRSDDKLEVEKAAADAKTEEPEELEAWKDSGKKVKTHFTDANLLSLSQKITTQAYSDELHAFVDKQESRFVGHEGNPGAAQYIEEQLVTLGLNVTEQPFTDNRVTNHMNPEDHSERMNVLGYMRGTDLAHEAVLLGAHFDSVNWEDTTAKAPGVDDNGSGMALLLAVARALKDAGPFRRTIVFSAFNAEEEGLVGSEAFVKSLGEGSEAEKTLGKIKAVLIADEVAWPGRGAERRKAIFETVGRGEGTSMIVDTLAHCANLANGTTAASGDGVGDGNHNFVVNYKGFGSDHISFLDAGIPAVLLIERDDEFHADTYGHSARDTFEHVDLDYGGAMSRLALRAVASMANPAD